MRKELIQKAYQMGYESFPRSKCSPYGNEDFKDILPEDCNLKVQMYKQYIKGWVRALLDFISKDK